MRQLKDFVFATIIVFLVHACAYAQSQPCTLKIDQLPEIRGFKLGMSYEQLMRRYPELKADDWSPDANGFLPRDLSMPSYVQSALGEKAAEGLAKVYFALLDGRLVRLRVTYMGLTEWDDVDEFLKVMATTLKLPAPQQWTKASDQARELKCDGVAVQIKLSPKLSRYELQEPSIALTVLSVEQILSEREKTKKERLRREFKP